MHADVSIVALECVVHVAIELGVSRCYFTLPVPRQLVAIKYLAVFETEARHTLARELKLLYKNLATLPSSTPGDAKATAVVPKAGPSASSAVLCTSLHALMLRS
jgi:hypothetical protein